MRKSILLIGYNFQPELTGIGKYSGEMMNWLAKDGYQCTVITAYPYYPYWKVQEPYVCSRHSYTTEYKHFDSGGSLTVHRCPMYVPAIPSGVKRILLDFSFLASATGKLLSLVATRKFDYVFVVAPSFQFGLLGILVKKISTTKFIYHIQDMQIEAARDLNIIKSQVIINGLLKIEKYIFSNADIISSISEGMVNRIREKAIKEVALFPNWTDTNLFYPIMDKSAAKALFGFTTTDKIILYSGAIGEKQGLEAIIETAKELKNIANLKFVICGSGPYKQKLQESATANKLENVVFLPLQDFANFNNFLNAADVHLVIQKANASDLVMPSKLSTILAVGGLALITANEDSSLYALVHKHQMGLIVKAENQSELTSGIVRALSGDNQQIKLNARRYAEAYLSIDGVMKKLKYIIEH
jgi:colanic acid biosynthesis glycosyl transferase WcaI